MKLKYLTSIQLIIILLLITLIFTGCSDESSTPDSNEKKVVEKIDIFHIHETPECFTCKIAGEHVEYALQTNFQDELDSGKITYSNIDKSDKNNEYLIKKFDVLQGYSGIYMEIHTDEGSDLKEYTNMADLDNKELFVSAFNKYIDELIGEN